jgi:diguanylate cyclase (GGDEF)-like protein
MMRDISIANRLRILLIEDSKGDAILVSKSIEQAMPGVVAISKATTIADALKQLSTETFDVALLDRTLPDAQEFDGLHSIQNMAPKLPVIFLTAYQDEQAALDAIENGAQDYMFKGKTESQQIKRAIQYAILRKQFEGVLIMRANFDALTGLTNRMLYESRLDIALARIKRHGGSVGVLFLDLDKFKQVNDTLGHAAGDKLLTDVATRLKQTLRPYDTAARFGGDEFAILLESVSDAVHSAVVAEKIIQLIKKPFQIAGQSVEIGVSIGIAVCDGTENADRDTILKRADSAMYEAKTISGNIYKFYETQKSVNTA